VLDARLRRAREEHGFRRHPEMSKYDALWKFIADQDKKLIILTFDDIKNINKVEIDHSFLNYKKELFMYGFSVGKISLKNRTVEFIKEDE
jgi:hypothetical protein